ncbi:hypothetical protein BMS3Bbin07_00915 [bacterium BMS3Bbin07]|nr:hypothetical protein BMS3Bbin07_00915 [bacterium BMS3Bbin07]HDH01679.1 hypothetical protein [Nitrospirota bacterium]
MNEKTRLEQELEKVQNKGKQWRGIVALLFVLLLLAALYIVNLRQKLYDAQEMIRSLNLKTDTLGIEIETFKLDAARCSDALTVPEDAGKEKKEITLIPEGPEKTIGETKDLQP